MSYPTLQNIFDEMRSNLGDDGVTGGEICTNTAALIQAQAAVRDMASAMVNVCDIRVFKTAYWVLPANTSVLIPSTMGVMDMAQPMSIMERGNLTIAEITGASYVDPTLTITAVAHGFQNNVSITQSKVGGMQGANGLFAITVTGTDSSVPNGAVGTGTYTSGGVAVYSPDDFQWMDFTQNVDTQKNNAGYLRYWTWDAGLNGFRFIPTGTERQLQIRYESSATVPTSVSDVVYVDNCLSFLGAWAAARFANTRLMQGHATRLATLACGPGMNIDRPGGMLWSLLQSSVRQMQRLPSAERTRPFFREPRALIDAVFIG